MIKIHTQTLQNGTTLTTEEKIIDSESLEIQNRITLDTQEEFKKAVLASEQEVLNQLPTRIINKNQYLKWRVADNVDISNAFHQLTAHLNQPTASELFQLCHNQLPGTGFLARCSWDTCWTYGLLMYEYEVRLEKAIAGTRNVQDHLQDVGLHEKGFMNDHMSSVLIDKILLHAYYNQTDTDKTWPLCVSGIPEVVSVSWGPSTVKVIQGSEFVFHLDERRLPANLREWRFKPPTHYFPLDLMLLLPQYKAVFLRQLEEDRLDVLEQKETDVGYQLYLANKLKMGK